MSAGVHLSARAQIEAAPRRGLRNGAAQVESESRQGTGEIERERAGRLQRLCEGTAALGTPDGLRVQDLQTG